MFRSTVLFSSIISMALLTGCITTRYLNGNELSVTYASVIWEVDRVEAFKQAREHCGFYNRVARLAETNSEDNLMTFHCIER